MASAVFHSWSAAGRPLTPSTPVREIVERMRVAFPRAAFSWYADEAHYEAVPPEDHTPFSATGWPVASPEWVVFAVDIMHNPTAGVDCNALFAYWLAEAKAGRMPWLKYLIWQAKRYDVRNGWKLVTSSDHFDHIHISVRTDAENTHLGAWSLVPTHQRSDMPGLFQISGLATLYMSDGFKRKTLTGTMWGQYIHAWGDQPISVVANEAELTTIAGSDWTTVGGAAMTPAQLDQVKQAAEDGASSAVDGATIHKAA